MLFLFIVVKLSRLFVNIMSDCEIERHLDMTERFWVGEFPDCCCWSTGGGADRGPLAQTLGKDA